MQLLAAVCGINCIAAVSKWFEMLLGCNWQTRVFANFTQLGANST